MNKIYIGFLMVMTSLCLNAQLITIKDHSNFEPLSGVKLIEVGKSITKITTETGRVDISGFSDGSIIEIQAYGYVSQSYSKRQLSSLSNGVLLMVHDPLSLDEVVVSANRWEQNKAEVPNKIVSINQKDIALQNPQTSADLLGFSNAVFVQKSQMGGGSPMIRGFSTNRLLITVDGVRMNTAIFRSGNVQNVISIDPLAVQKSEVIFGPGSVIYGSDAIGGVMNFYTLEPQFSESDEVYVKGNALTRYASANNERTAHFDLNLGWKKWASSSSISFSQFGDLRMGSDGPDDYLVPNYVGHVDSQDVMMRNPDPLVQNPTAYDQISLMQKIRFKPTENVDFQYGVHYSTTSNYARFDRHRRERNGHLRYGEWYYGPQEWMMQNLRISHSGANAVYDKMNVNVAYQFFEESRHSRNFGSDNLESNTEQVNAYSLNIDFEKGDEKPHRFFYGFEAVINEVSSDGIQEDIYTAASSLIPTRYPDGSTWSSYAAYLSYEFVPSEKWAFQLGTRYNAFGIDATFDTSLFALPYNDANMAAGALTGSLGSVYSPVKNVKIRANLSTGFRAPNIDDVGKLFESVDKAVVVPNPNLKAEYAYNGELGVAWVIDSRVKLDVTGFYTLLNNAQVRRPFQLNGNDSIFYDGEMSQVLAIQNAAKATVYGFQASIDIKLGGGFALSSVYSVQKGEEELDDGTKAPLRHAAPAFGATHLTFSQHKLFLDAYAVYNDGFSFPELAPSEQQKTEIYAADANGDPYAPSWYTFNVKGSYQLNDTFTITAGLENILDKRYLPYSSGIVAPGRNFIMSLRASF